VQTTAVLARHDQDHSGVDGVNSAVDRSPATFGWRGSTRNSDATSLIRTGAWTRSDRRPGRFERVRLTERLHGPVDQPAGDPATHRIAPQPDQSCHQP
jgi:hypothetical protein